MATKLSYAAQMAMDLFYQDFQPRNAYFTLNTFMLEIAWAYSEMIDLEFQAKRNEGKAENGFANIENSSAWLIEEKLTTQYLEEKDKVVAFTSQPIFAFRWDNTCNALQGIRPLKGTNNYRKISLNEARFNHVTPQTNFIYYLVSNGKEIEFIDGIAGVEIFTKYIPVVVGNDANCVMADGIVKQVIDKVLQTHFVAKNGNVIQKADDGNSNSIIQQQVNPSLK